MRLCKLVTIPCPNSIYPLGLLKQLNEFLPKKKKERACKLNLGRNSQRGRCCFPMKHHTPIADPLTLLNSSQSKTFTYNKQRITFSVGIKIHQTPMPYAQMPAVGTWPLPEHCNPPQHCYVFHSQVLSPPPCGPLLPDRHMVQWPASPLSSCSYVYREAVSPSSLPFTCSQAARQP